jgi:hypothetical protein
LSVLGRLIRLSRNSHKAALGAVACIVLMAGAGCGSGGEIADGTAVTVYAGAPLCAGAKGELARRGDMAGSVRVRLACLKDAQQGGRLNLARTGANARRATEDSTSVAYVVPPGREATFSRPILEEAQIAVITSNSGAKAMATILAALDSRGEMTPREAVEKAK